MASRSALVSLLAAVTLLAGAGQVAAAATDPVQEGLERSDVFVATGQIGDRAPLASRELSVVASELGTAGRPVKLAVVAGRGGGRSLLLYARRLRRNLGYDGTVVLTTPGGATAAAGPRESAEVTLRLRRARIGRISDPVERLVSAAEVTAAPRRSAGGTRIVLTLIALAVLGGAWAIAIGAGRRARLSRQALAEKRAAMRVHVDTLRARASALARSAELPDDARPQVQSALGTYADAITALQQAGSPEEVERLASTVAAGLEALTEAGRRAGEAWAEGDDPFAGLCAADPAHGPSEGYGPLVPDGRSVPLCARCGTQAERGERVQVRMIPAGGVAIPFNELASLSSTTSSPS